MNPNVDSCGPTAARSNGEVAQTTRKSWSELKNVVNNCRMELQAVSSGISPMNIEFRTLTDGRVRMYFLSVPPKGWGDTTLLWCDIGPQDTTPTNEMYRR